MSIDYRRLTIPELEKLAGGAEGDARAREEINRRRALAAAPRTPWTRTDKLLAWIAVSVTVVAVNTLGYLFVQR